MSVKKHEQKEEVNNNPQLVEDVVTEMKKLFTFDIMYYVKKPWKLIGLNFLMGVVRGIGFFLGMTIVGAIVFVVLMSTLKKITHANIPIISEWLAKVVILVQENLKMLQ
ncbi:MAG: hypothetical protein JW983_02055 [Elusimicrobia bacterium]|nr:hypothetical protein [Elusimicrobiota bacterium]